GESPGHAGSVQARSVQARPVEARSVEAIADTPHGGERQRLAELLAQLPHVYVDRALVAVPVGSPDTVEELLAREREPGVLREELQQVELARGERDDPTVHPHLAPGGVDLDAAHHDLGSLAHGRLGAAQDGTYPGHELTRRERLGDVVVGA